MVWHKETALPDGPRPRRDPRRLLLRRLPALRRDRRARAGDARGRRLRGGGGHVLGVCNGFQVLIEAGLLPGALMRNAGLKFVCARAPLSVGTADSPFTEAYRRGREAVSFPIAHHDGAYVADPETLARLEGEDRVAFRYRDNPNGSMNAIAGVLSENRRVLGLMPHPERAVDPALGGTDGARLFEGLARRGGRARALQGA